MKRVKFKAVIRSILTNTCRHLTFHRNVFIVFIEPIKRDRMLELTKFSFQCIKDRRTIREILHKYVITEVRLRITKFCFSKVACYFANAEGCLYIVRYRWEKPELSKFCRVGILIQNKNRNVQFRCEKKV